VDTLTIRIVALYAVPVIAVGLALGMFILLRHAVRRGATTLRRAIAWYATTAALPFVAVAILAAVAQWGSAWATGAFDARAMAATFVELLPLAGYIAIPIVAMLVAFPIAAQRAATARGGRQPVRRS
jgi:hypothetical protein